jgi:hypothetical protein
LLRLYPATVVLLAAATSLGGGGQSWSGLPPGQVDLHWDSPFGFHPASVAQTPGVSFRGAHEIGVRWHRPVVYAFWSLVQPNRASPRYDWGLLDSQYCSVPEVPR